MREMMEDKDADCQNVHEVGNDVLYACEKYKREYNEYHQRLTRHMQMTQELKPKTWKTMNDEDEPNPKRQRMR